MTEPSARIKSSPKVASFRSRQLELFDRFEQLRQVCIELVQEVDPQKRAHLLGRLAILKDSGVPSTDGAVLEPTDGS